ncbi:MmgE/PrpD family protein [Phytohabitans houttuyneae]|uniref:2-methylcitrate dehydratase n=1 Tax=Phytohabitans houttuyneae TaxID=1076126 RepID=A0A6V8KGA9_9ACTN|nr:MmgE/PrpD family protein [Phytohabitans houttuyneae]GFJ81428.1 hypothetical protein Phou_056080 [Phytohabitans houttuyneae]
MSTLIEDLSEFLGGLDLADVPSRVVDLVTSQILSQLATIRIGMRNTYGRQLIEAFGPPLQSDVQRSACVLGAIGSWLNLEDTCFVGHLSSSAVGVPLAYAYARRLGGPELITGVLAANECAARLSAAATLGPFRGQTAMHTHLAGAVAGRLRCERAPLEQWSNALGIAFTMAPWALNHGFMTSDARVLHAFNPIRSAMDSCDAAAVGLTGPADILEHPGGFLDQFATVPLPESVTAGLGERWHTDTLSFKLHPGGPGIDTAVDCAIELHDAVAERGVDDIAEVTVRASLYTTLADRTAAAYVDGPATPMGALLLRTEYSVATALMTGGLRPDDFLPPAVGRHERWRLAAKIKLDHDEVMTRELFSGDAPFGEAIRQAGSRADPWLRSVGGDELVQLLDVPAPPRKSFTNATKRTPARVTVKFRDGTVVSRGRLIPVGAAGSERYATHYELTREKFLAAGGPPDVADAVAELCDIGPAAMGSLIRQALFG